MPAARSIVLALMGVLLAAPVAAQPYGPWWAPHPQRPDPIEDGGDSRYYLVRRGARAFCRARGEGAGWRPARREAALAMNVSPWAPIVDEAVERARNRCPGQFARNY